MTTHKIIVPAGDARTDIRLELTRLLTAAGFQINFLFIGRRKGQGLWHAYHGDGGCIVGRSMPVACVELGFEMRPIAGEHWDAMARKSSSPVNAVKLPEPMQPGLPPMPLLTALEFYRAELYRCGMLSESDSNRVVNRLNKEAGYYE